MLQLEGSDQQGQLRKMRLLAKNYYSEMYGLQQEADSAEALNHEIRDKIRAKDAEIARIRSEQAETEKSAEYVKASKLKTSLTQSKEVLDKEEGHLKMQIQTVLDLEKEIDEANAMVDVADMKERNLMLRHKLYLVRSQLEKQTKEYEASAQPLEKLHYYLDRKTNEVKDIRAKIKDYEKALENMQDMIQSYEKPPPEAGH